MKRADRMFGVVVLGGISLTAAGPAAAASARTTSPSLPAHPGAAAGDRVLFHVVELCCLGETLGLFRLPPERPTSRGGLEAYGFLGRRAGEEVCARALRGVILPGFRELGVDLGPAQAIVRQFR